MLSNEKPTVKSAVTTVRDIVPGLYKARNLKMNRINSNKAPIFNGFFNQFYLFYGLFNGWSSSFDFKISNPELSVAWASVCCW